MRFKLIGQIIYEDGFCQCIDEEIEAVSGEEAIHKAREIVKKYPRVYKF